MTGESKNMREFDLYELITIQNYVTFIGIVMSGH